MRSRVSSSQACWSTASDTADSSRVPASAARSSSPSMAWFSDSDIYCSPSVEDTPRVGQPFRAGVDVERAVADEAAEQQVVVVRQLHGECARGANCDDPE